MTTETRHHTAPAVPSWVDEQVIKTATHRGEIIPRIADIVGKTTVSTTISMEQTS